MCWVSALLSRCPPLFPAFLYACLPFFFFFLDSVVSSCSHSPCRVPGLSCAECINSPLPAPPCVLSFSSPFHCASSMCPRKCCRIIVVAETLDLLGFFFWQTILTKDFSNFMHLFWSPLPHTSFLLLSFSWIFLFPQLFIFLSYSYNSACNHSLHPLSGMHEKK